jgi:hypothetical protein
MVAHLCDAVRDRAAHTHRDFEIVLLVRFKRPGQFDRTGLQKTGNGLFARVGREQMRNVDLGDRVVGKVDDRDFGEKRVTDRTRGISV